MAAEFPPLLPPGRHGMRVDVLEQICVTGFPLSTRRPEIMKSLMEMLHELTKQEIQAEVWVDGSFLTQKMEPKDVDVLVTFGAQLLTSGSPGQLALIKRIEEQDFKTPLPCDSYILPIFPQADSNFGVSESMWGYWIKQFCFDRNSELKGLAVITTPLT